MPEALFLDARPMRRKRHRLLLVLDEFPLLGRMPHFEKNMGAMAGYGLKAYLVAQSPNHIIGAYGRDNVIIDNCHVITAFAAADGESAKRISDMAGDAVEVRPQASEHIPRSLLGPRKGSLTYREERRPLMLPGEIRKLPRDEQLIFVSGAKPIRAKKLEFDREEVFLKRLLPAPRGRQALTRENDWIGVRPLGRLIEDKTSGAVRVEPEAGAAGQGDLFTQPLSNYERAPAGRRTSGAGVPEPTKPRRTQKPQSTGV